MCLHELDHLLAHGDRLLVHVAAVDGVPLAVRVVHHGFDLSLGHGVDHVPEVGFVAAAALVYLRW